MKKHSNLSIFVPHQGCPCRCSFCNQNEISGTQNPPTGKDVTELCEEFLPQKGEGENTEIAFFGGSFTAIKKEYMLELLQSAYPFILAKRAKGIRISTRPDAIDNDILAICRQYGVTAIELGAQSMNDAVLLKNKRGHNVLAVETAAALIKNGGFSLGLQMMTGLFGEENTEKSAFHTMESFIALKPDTVRIYPALVVKNTLLAKWWQEGIYIPQTVEDATSLCAKLIVGFENAKIKVIRVGLHADTELENNFLAGPYHPAFKQICESKIYFEKISTLLKTVQKGDVTLLIPKGETSTVAGQKKCMLAEFKSMGYNINLQENEKLTGRMINIMP